MITHNWVIWDEPKNQPIILLWYIILINDLVNNALSELKHVGSWSYVVFCEMFNSQINVFVFCCETTFSVHRQKLHFYINSWASWVIWYFLPRWVVGSGCSPLGLRMLELGGIGWADWGFCRGRRCSSDGGGLEGLYKGGDLNREVEGITVGGIVSGEEW